MEGNMNTNGFDIQWQKRENALNEAQNSVPCDDVILSMAKKAQRQGKTKRLWVPYAAAACLLSGVIVYGLTLPNNEVKFLCNSGCSAQDVIISANKIINQE